MIDRVLVDAGPLVAIASPRDQHHSICVEQLHDLRPPLISSWPVLAEVTWLIRDEPASLESLSQMAQQGWLELPALDVMKMLAWFRRFHERYIKLAPQLADATLVYLAERERIDTVFTADRRDFSIYRIGRNRAFRLLPESL